MQLGDKLSRTFFVDSTMPIDFLRDQWRDFVREVEGQLEAVERLQKGAPSNTEPAGKELSAGRV